MTDRPLAVPAKEAALEDLEQVTCSEIRVVSERIFSSRTERDMGL
jgi:hypothetical protein